MIVFILNVVDVFISDCINIECIYVCLFVIVFILNVADVFICDCINIECIYLCLLLAYIPIAL